MTIDEAIRHCEEVAENYRCERDDAADINDVGTASDCQQCANDHEQLAKWLRELVAYKKLRICGNCRHYVSGTTHFGECHVTSDIEPCVVGVDQTACDTFFDYKDFRNGV